MEIVRSIQNRIFELKGERVMLGFYIAELYEVAVKVINQAVKRNIKRFPEDFMFRLSSSEWNTLRSQLVRAFVAARRLSLQEMDLRIQLKEIKDVLGVHDSRLKLVCPTPDSCQLPEVRKVMLGIR